MPTSTVEDYLKAIYQAQQSAPAGLAPTGQIANALRVAPGTATAMVKTLADAGLVHYEPYTGVRLTASGRKLATHVLRRHRLVELFLVEVMGMDWSEVHGEAELLEHAVSDRLIQRIDEMLGHPDVDPHGDPIPTVAGVVREVAHADLLSCPADTRLKVVRVTDQRRDFLQLLDRYRLMPGREARVTARDREAGTVTVRNEAGDEVNLGFRAASKILVATQT